MITENLKNITSQLDTVQVHDPYEFLSIHLIPFEFITQKLASLYSQVPSVYELNERSKQQDLQDSKLKERMTEFEKVTKQFFDQRDQFEQYREECEYDINQTKQRFMAIEKELWGHEKKLK